MPRNSCGISSSDGSGSGGCTDPVLILSFQSPNPATVRPWSWRPYSSMTGSNLTPKWSHTVVSVLTQHEFYQMLRRMGLAPFNRTGLTLVASRRMGILQPHANFGYEFWSKGVPVATNFTNGTAGRRLFLLNSCRLFVRLRLSLRVSAK